MRTLYFFSALAISMLISINLQAVPLTDTLSNILRSKESDSQQQIRIARLCVDRFLRSSNNDHLATSMPDSLAKYGLSGQAELKNYIQVMILRRKMELEKVDQLLKRSIALSQQHSETTFLYLFYLNQAYIQTDLNNPLNAVYHYRLARKAAEEIGNKDLFVTTDIGISDIYTNIGLYQKALIYLDKAQSVIDTEGAGLASSQPIIYLNKSEVFFKLGILDSLHHYTELTRLNRNSGRDMDRNLKRLDYFNLILANKHQMAIPLIQYLLATGNQYYKTIDKWHLTECYYHTGKLDSAQILALELTQNHKSTSSPIRLEAYKLLAKIFETRGNIEESNRFLSLALRESESYTLRISKIGDLSSELRLDRMEASYNAQNLIYEKERTIMIVTIIGVILGIIAILVSYINIRQKNRFQKQLNLARTKQLSFINSHKVRKPLANILGICNLADKNNAKKHEMAEYLHIVYQEAREMDEKLREVEKKLNTQK